MLTVAWAQVTRGQLRIHRGVGDHNHMLAMPYLDRNAALIREIIERIAGSAGIIMP